ncbi:hypothetical protein VTO42DRAFT_8644 [Malbranchea cinnamomea]
MRSQPVVLKEAWERSGQNDRLTLWEEDEEEKTENEKEKWVIGEANPTTKHLDWASGQPLPTPIHSPKSCFTLGDRNYRCLEVVPLPYLTVVDRQSTRRLPKHGSAAGQLQDEVIGCNGAWVKCQGQLCAKNAKTAKSGCP